MKYFTVVPAQPIEMGHRALQCDLCDKKNHIRCDGILIAKHISAKKSKEKHYFKLCKENTFAFDFFISIIKSIDINDDFTLSNLKLNYPNKLRLP